MSRLCQCIHMDTKLSCNDNTLRKEINTLWHKHKGGPEYNPMYYRNKKFYN